MEQDEKNTDKRKKKGKINKNGMTITRNGGHILDMGKTQEVWAKDDDHRREGEFQDASENESQVIRGKKKVRHANMEP